MGYYLQFVSVLPILALSVTMGGIVYMSLFIISNVYLQLFLGSLVGITMYLSFSKLFNLKEFIFLLIKLKKVTHLGLNVK
jgi:hypothetical protein